MPEKFFITVKALIKNRKGEILLLRRKHKTKGYMWDLAGGRVAREETHLETLVREIKEEIPSIEKITYCRLVHLGRLGEYIKDNTDLFFIFYAVDANFTEIELTDEHEEYYWVDTENVYSVMSFFPDTKMDKVILDSIIRYYERATITLDHGQKFS